MSEFSTKYIFFDIDGTLWDEHMEIPQSTQKAIAKLTEMGHKAFICTGRSRANINSEQLLQLGFSGIVAACGNYIEMDGQVIYEKNLDQNLVRQIVDLCDACNMPVVLEGSKYQWISTKGFENDPFVEKMWESLGDAGLPLDGYEESIVINKFSADILPETDFKTIEKEMSVYFDILMHNDWVAEFVPKGTSKATGIEWLCNHMNVAIEDTYAVGDSVNDLDMLEFVGHGIAMGNATEIAKKSAEYITEDIHADGIYNAMKHYALIS